MGDLRASATKSVVGKRVTHESASRHVSGHAQYTDDLCGHFPGLLHAWPVQANVACGTVTSIDGADALRVPGVVTVLQKEDVAGVANVGPTKLDEPIFPRQIAYYGQPVTWVIAETEEAAIQGAANVDVQIERVPRSSR